MINVGKYILHSVFGYIVISCCFILCLNNCSYPEARHDNSWCPSIQHVAPRCHADVLFVEMHIAGLPKGLASPLLKMTPFLENTRAFTKTSINSPMSYDNAYASAYATLTPLQFLLTWGRC